MLCLEPPDIPDVSSYYDAVISQVISALCVWLLLKHPPSEPDNVCSSPCRGFSEILCSAFWNNNPKRFSRVSYEIRPCWKREQLGTRCQPKRLASVSSKTRVATGLTWLYVDVQDCSSPVVSAFGHAYPPEVTVFRRARFLNHTFT